MEVIQITTNCMALIEILKRFIPKKYQYWLNPAAAIILGGSMGFANGGLSGILDGMVAGSASIAAYKVPKVVGGKLIKNNGVSNAPS